jgi:magnesium chelatase subunit H
MQKPISPAEIKAITDAGLRSTQVRVVIVTLDAHMASAAARANASLMRDLPGVSLRLHSVTDWAASAEAHQQYELDVASADIIIASMVFTEEHVALVKPALDARREACDAIVCCMSAPEIVKLTRIGQFSMAQPASGVMSMLRRLAGKGRKEKTAGANQMKMLRTLPKLLRFIPGKAQDLRSYFLTLQYLLSGSDENIANLVRYLISKYGSGEREKLRALVAVAEPVEYPEIGLYHPNLPKRVTDELTVFQRHVPQLQNAKGTVGILLMRSYLLADNTAHYDGVIKAMQDQGLNVVPAFASGLDGRGPIERYFMANGKPTVDCVVSLTGFSLVGGPAYNDTAAAEATLSALDVPYISAYAMEFQSIQEWGRSEQGLTPVETTIMVALPEIDGATGPIMFGGRADQSGPCTGCERRCSFSDISQGRDMQSCGERADMLAERAARMVVLRRTAKAERKIATIIYNFPPNGGAVGSAAFLSVFHSLQNTLTAMKADGYSVEVPESIDALRDAILGGNAMQLGMPANVAYRMPLEDHLRGEKHLTEIEAQWGAAPGRIQTNGRELFVFGAHFGNVFVGVQPAFGYEGDPMRLLFEKSFTPTHAFSAFYRYVREEFAAHAVLHFGTHGALEFMPGKQSGLSGKCWPDRLIGALPNLYLYAANNPSEGTIARRRSAATLITYLTPPIGKAGLYKGLLDLKAGLERWRVSQDIDSEEHHRLTDSIFAQAVRLDLLQEEATPGAASEAVLAKLITDVTEYEMTLVPHGLHVIGQGESFDARFDVMSAYNEAHVEGTLPEAMVEAIAKGEVVSSDRLTDAQREMVETLFSLNASLSCDNEMPAILRALDARYIAPVAGGDVLRAPEIAPTGRNMHGFDPFRMPSAFAVADGMHQANLLVERYARDHGYAPKRIAMVLWGTDNLKTEGAQIAQALALMGARPRFDSFGRLAGADLIPLSELGRPRIDVVSTLSGIFRDLLPLQTRLLADAALKAAEADGEHADDNPIRAHALAYAAKNNCSLEDAALRVFSNASGVYGSNVNLLIDSSAWDEEDELANTYQSRKSFAYGRNGKPVKQEKLLTDVLSVTDTAFQNIESVELGITSVDHYFDTLGGITKAIKKAGGGDIPVYLGDATTGTGKVRTLSEQVALETRTRVLNPKFYEGLLAHGYEGVRQIESHVTNTLGWSATTGQVSPWVYKQLTETFVLDVEMRERMAKLNPKASSKLANRLIEAGDRNFWTPDPDVWDALKAASEELEDRVEGIMPEAAL